MSDAQQRPFSIRMFVPDGDSDGLRVVEKSNWTGVGIVFRRTNYKQAAGREEFKKTGVYILVGSSEQSSLPTVYVGEGDPVKNRLDDHYRKKDYWDWAVFFVTKDSSLNKAHVKYLESRLLALATEAKQCRLENSKASFPPSLSESEKADVESFLIDMLSIFPLLGLSLFEKVEAKSKPIDILYIKTKGIKASGYEDTKGFVVTQGSQMMSDTVPTTSQSTIAMRNDLIQQNVVALEGQHYRFSQDHIFTSPSTAAAIVMGRTANGRIEWKTEDGKTLKEIQEASIVHEMDNA